MPLINKLPQRVNKWLQDGKKLGLISDKQQLDFISKYVSLRLSGTPVLKRKAKTMVEDQIDKVIDNLILCCVCYKKYITSVVSFNKSNMS